MGVKRQNSDLPPQPAWLDWLHRDQDGDLTPGEQQALNALPHQDEIRRQRLALSRVTEHLGQIVPPPLPTSLAGQVAQEVAWSARLTAASPALTHSVAADVASAIAAAYTLGRSSVPVLPPTTAPRVVGDIQTARQLRHAETPVIPQSVAPSVAHEVAWAARTQMPAPAMPRSVAGQVVARLQGPAAPAQAPAAALPPTSVAAPAPLPVGALGVAALPVPQRNPAPTLLVVLLMVGLTLLAVTSAWPNLAAGALVLRTLLAQVSPLAGVGLALLLVTSALITWRPGPVMQRVGAGAFALSAMITLPALTALASSGDIRFGQNITVNSAINGNVIAVGGNIHLLDGARVNGQVVTLLGDVQRDSGAYVSGRVNALLGKAPGDTGALQTSPPEGIGLATAAAFRPVLGWLGSAAWPQIFLTLTGGALLLLFVAGMAPTLARRQRHAPMRTLALGVLALAALLGPALGLALAGLLGPALVAAALAGVLIAVGLSVSAYDVGRALALRAHLPVPDAVGAMLGLTGMAASFSQPTLALALGLVGGAWGAGTLLLTRHPSAASRQLPAA